MAQGPEHTFGGRTASEVFSDASVARFARAACEGRVDEMRRLLTDGVHPDAQGFEGMTPLLWAQNCGNIEGIRVLLEAGANPNGVTADLNPVLVAISVNNTEMLQLLLEHGGDPNATWPNTQWTALTLAYDVALDHRSWTNYDLLLASGADINRRYAGSTIAEFAAVLNGWEKVAELLDRGYNRDLDRLGGFAQGADPETMSKEQERWLAIVRNELERRNVRFPVPSTGCALRRSCLEYGDTLDSTDHRNSS
jgi:hypothetical protein